MASHALMSHEVVPDALPYVDQGYDEPGVREMVSSTCYLYAESIRLKIHYYKNGLVGIITGLPSR